MGARMAQTKKSARRDGAAGKSSHAALKVASATAPNEPTVPAVTSAPKRADVLQLGTSLSIREVSECAAQLKALLATESAEVDVSRLESIDTAGIQLLLVTAMAAQRRGFKLKLLGAQRLQTGAVRALGLAEHLAMVAEIVP
jgi:ABC-type transporter Mla MlaB component